MDFEPSDRALRKHVPVPNIQGKYHDTTKKRASEKRLKQEDSPIKDIYQGFVECADIKVHTPIKDFGGGQDSIKNQVEKGKKHAEATQTTQ